MNSKVYKALDIAKYIINKCTCEEKKQSVTCNYKRYCIIYKKSILVKYGCPLFSDDMYA